jgi:opacity protein-like surface antigen
MPELLPSYQCCIAQLHASFRRCWQSCISRVRCVRPLLWSASLCGTLGTFAVCQRYELPPGKVFEIRLTKSLASFSSREGSPVEGVIIAPVWAGEQVVIPAGSKISGEIEHVNRVGFGLIHETARLDLNFDKVTLPNGTVLPIHTSVREIDNARETVDDQGRVKGIRSTGTLGFRANNFIAGVAMLDPIAYIYVTIASARMLRFSEPEIWFPAGTELSAVLAAPITLPNAFPPSVPAVGGSVQQREDLRSIVRSLPFRTASAETNKPSDLTNLVFLGSPAALQRAFLAAGWVRADRLNALSAFRTMRSIAENQRYESAPMSVLLLDEQRPHFEFSKSLNTFSKRHHVRIWLRSETWSGHPLLTASSTQDIGIQLSRKQRTFIHVIDTNVDNERAKIVNDLIFTGCVDAAEYQPRPWLPKDASNATGEALKTDGRIAIVQLNECEHPHDPVDLRASPDIPATGNVVERGFRQGILLTRNDIYRGNLVYQAIEGTRMGVRYLKHKDQPQTTAASPPDLVPLEDKTHESLPPLSRDRVHESTVPTAYEAVPQAPSAESGPLFELGVHGGWLGFGSNLSSTTISLEPKSPANQPITLFFANRIESGWDAGTSVTLNSWRWFSNEFAFDYQRGRYRLGAQITGLGDLAPTGYQEEGTGLAVNQFGYAFLVNLRPRESRFRAYVAAGPALQLLHITEAPIKKPNAIFRAGLRNVGLILAAYNFANEPPLDGGGVFQFGFQYGGGIKYRIASRLMLSADYRETLSAQPNFVERSITIDSPSSSDEYIFNKITDGPGSPLRLKRASFGISFVF